MEHEMMEHSEILLYSDENGKEFLLFVNNSQDKIERIEGEYKGKKLFNWFAPGQMLIVEE